LAAFAVLVLALVVTGGLYALLAPASTAQEDEQTKAIEQGHQLFLANCSTCHGKEGQGTSDGPSLVGAGAAAVSFQVGTGRMPLAEPGVQAPRVKVLFNEDEINAMAAYVASLGPGPAIPSAEQLDYADANITEGGEIFRTNCAMCHNFAGAGGALTKGKYAPPLTGVSAKHIYEAMLTGPQSMPQFSEATLPTEDKQAIIAYLKTIQNDPPVGGLALGSVGPVSEGLVVWIVGIGGLIVCAIWLGWKSS
jgi:ubiquinol-cytochrome c reductase cytochrome c subunit